MLISKTNKQSYLKENSIHKITYKTDKYVYVTLTNKHKKH